MQELLLTALVAYQSHQNLESRVTPEPYRSFVRREYKQHLKPTIRYTNRRRVSPSQTPAFRSKRNPIIFSKPAEAKPKAIAPKVRKTLIIAPHPDDEIICCANLMKQRVTDGERVQVVYLTDGDALDSYNTRKSRLYGRERRRESIRAMASIGVTPRDLIFLNFPDGSLHLLGSDVFTSDYTKQDKSLTASHFNRTAYTRDNLKKNLRRIVRNYSPDEIYVPSITHDRHKDHQVAASIIDEVVGSNAQILEYTVHSHKRPTLSTSVDTQKLELLRLFKSQFHDKWHTDFMESFARLPEKFNQKNTNTIATK